MKKIIVIALSLTMLLALAAPALATSRGGWAPPYDVYARHGHYTDEGFDACACDAYGGDPYYEDIWEQNGWSVDNPPHHAGDEIFYHVRFEDTGANVFSHSYGDYLDDDYIGAREFLPDRPDTYHWVIETVNLTNIELYEVEITTSEDAEPVTDISFLDDIYDEEAMTLDMPSEYTGYLVFKATVEQTACGYLEISAYGSATTIDGLTVDDYLWVITNEQEGLGWWPPYFNSFLDLPTETDEPTGDEPTTDKPATDGDDAPDTGDGTVVPAPTGGISLAAFALAATITGFGAFGLRKRH